MRTVCEAKVVNGAIEELSNTLLKSGYPDLALRFIGKDYEKLWSFCDWLKTWIDTEVCDIDDAEIIKAQMIKYDILEGKK